MKLLNPGHKGTQVAEKGLGIGKGRPGKQGCRTPNGSNCSEITFGTERHRPEVCATGRHHSTGTWS